MATVDKRGVAPVNQAEPTAPARKYAWQLHYPEAKAVRVVFEESPEIPPTGLFVQINGDPFVIVAGEEVEVPDFLLTHMDNAVAGNPIINPQTAQVVGFRNKTRFPYRVLARDL